MPATMGSAIALSLGCKPGGIDRKALSSVLGGASCDWEPVGVAIGDHLVIVFAAQEIGAKERAVVVAEGGLSSL